VDGFFEWHEFMGKKYPYYIRSRDGEAFALAGIWDAWEDREADETIRTFSIITTRANALLERIHKTKKRMPVILARPDEARWLETDPEAEGIRALMEAVSDVGLEAHTVSKLITYRGGESNTSEVQERFRYRELPQKDLDSF
jgi:putative SOS response-associated peptidase YedK